MCVHVRVYICVFVCVWFKRNYRDDWGAISETRDLVDRSFRKDAFVRRRENICTHAYNKYKYDMSLTRFDMSLIKLTRESTSEKFRRRD